MDGGREGGDVRFCLQFAAMLASSSRRREGGRGGGKRSYLLRLQIDKHQVIIRPTRHKGKSRLQQRLRQPRAVLQHLLLVLLEFRRSYLLQRRGQRGNGVVVRSTLGMNGGGREGRRISGCWKFWR